MFNSRFLSNPQKFILASNFNNYLNDSIKKYDKLTIETNEAIKKTQITQKILNKDYLTKTISNHVQYDFINKSKFYNFIFISSVVSIGALIFYKNNLIRLFSFHLYING